MNTSINNNAVTGNTDRIAQDHNNTLFVQENTVMNTFNMNTFKKIANRATVLLAFGGLFALSQPAAKADVVILSALGSAQTQSAPGTTSMQFLVWNNDNFTVSGAKVSTSVFAFSGLLVDTAYPVSSPFSLTPYQSRWVTVALPASGINHMSLLNKNLTVYASTSPRGTYAFSFQNVLPQAEIAVNETHTSADPHTGAITYSVDFVNNGFAVSNALTVTVKTWRGNGPGEEQGQPLTQTQTLPALQIGQKVTMAFTSQPPQGYTINGTLQAGSINIEL